MLILTRKLGESIVIGEEVFKKIKEENKMASASGIVDLDDISNIIK